MHKALDAVLTEAVDKELIIKPKLFGPHQVKIIEIIYRTISYYKVKIIEIVTTSKLLYKIVVGTDGVIQQQVQITFLMKEKRVENQINQSH